jgi:hypothetical protein
MSLISRLFLLLVLLVPAAGAQDVYVPGELRDWRSWVLEGKEYRACPFLFDRGAEQPADFICAWPGLLELTVDADGGRFTLRFSVYGEDQWLPLPGDTAYWPDAVTANGRPATVVARGDLPSVRLGPGEYLLAGRFEWDAMPGVLQVPERVGLLALTVDGRTIARPERTPAGVFLGEREQPTEARDAVALRIFRRVEDNVPIRLVTRLQLDVSGRVREEGIGPLLPEGFTPLTLRSPLPARLEADGILRLQVRPGSWAIEVTARAAGVSDTLTPPANGPVTEEVWSYAANDNLRVTVAEGGAPVDPQQADVPPEWRQLPAFRLAAGDRLAITERSRGIVGASNELTLSRRMWLDFDGAGYVVSDTIGGSMRTGWRLDMNTPYTLLNAAVDDADLLITRGAREGQTGVELRRADLRLGTLGRAETRGALAVTGWDARLAGVSAELNLPPGHRLLAAPGVDIAAGAWVNRWQLLDFFVVLVITIGTWRLIGRGAGVLALVAITLGFHEAGAPSWLWLNLLIAIALLRVAPQGRLRQSARVYQIGSAALLLFALIPFVVGQITIALYPQLERQFGILPLVADTAAVSGMRPEVMKAEAPVAELALRESRVLATEADELLVDAARPAPADSYSRYAPDAVVQAGTGKPAWQWNSYRLDWGGPVTADQTMRLVILPRWSVTLLRLLDVALLLLFAGVLAAEMLGRRLRLPGGMLPGGRPAAGATLVAAAALLLAASPGAGAQTPDPGILEELERRLLEPPACVPRCAEIVAADVTVRADAVRMRLSAHSLATVALPLPGAEQGWRPTAIAIDGASAAQVVRGPGQGLWILLPAGRHELELTGPTGAADSVVIPFATPPRVISVEADGWLVAGIRDRRLLSGSLELTRLQTEQDDGSPVVWEASRFPTFAEVTRSVRLDLDWSVVTQVLRIAPATGSITLELPLLEGEAVLTEGVSVANDRALVTLGPDQAAFSWRSTLPRTTRLEMDAEAGAAWQEIWRVGAGRTWHVGYAGVPQSEQRQFEREAHTALFYPRGGESLLLEIGRPEASAGSTLAFDSAALALDVGSRSRSTTLSLDYRSTRGAQHVVRLPAGAEVTEVRIDGRVEPLRAEDGELSLPILPGKHTIGVSFRETAGVSLVSATPGVDIGAPASNISLRLELPGNRWLLATDGPPLGPAVLYWPELAALVLFALLLGRVRFTPLRSRHWLLLGLGFSTFNWIVMGWVVFWLLACGLRERMRGDEPWLQFNAAQVGIAFLTVTSLLAIVVSLPQGLLGTPDMHVTGNGSYGNALAWFADRSESALPEATAWSVPLWTYKVLILAWALWLSFALLRWLPWVWQCFTKHGLWRSRLEIARTPGTDRSGRG